MANKACEVKDLHFVSEKLDLPIFLTTRNRIKFDSFRTVPNYLMKKRFFYAQDCYSEARKTTKNREYFKRLITKYPAHDESCHESLIKKINLPSSKRENYPAPNYYNTMYEPFSSRRGLGAAYWPKLKEVLILKLQAKKLAAAANPKGNWKFYNILNGVEHLNLPRNKYKGKFMSNPRKRRATSRCMVTDPCLIYHDPKEPSPAEYNIKLHTIAYNMASKKYHEKLNPHLFLPGSCVPDCLRMFIPRHLSFLPAVGRYENRYTKHCACRKKIFTPGHIPNKRIKVKLYCDPDWDHVIGHGHQHIFRLPGVNQYKPKLRRSKEGQRSDKPLHLFHDSKYLKMITTPKQYMMRRISDLRFEPQIPFNCVFTNKRRVINIDRKVGFGGGTQRFSEYLPTILTHEKVKKIIENLPPERKLQNHPVTSTSIKYIKSRLDEIPKHMKSINKPDLPKKFFKFPPLPDPKLLATKYDLLPELSQNENYKPPRAFNIPLDVYDFIDTKSDEEEGTTYQHRRSETNSRMD